MVKKSFITPEVKKYFYIFVLVCAGVYFFVYVLPTFKPLLEIYTSQRDENLKRQEKLSGYSSSIRGQIFRTSDENNIPCVSTSFEAMNYIISELESEYSSTTYYKSEIEPKLAQATTDQDSYFYKLTLPKDIQGTKFIETHNFFKCDFFTPEIYETIASEETLDGRLLGTLGSNKRSPTELKDLVDILYHFKIISLSDFGNSIELNEQNIEEAAESITLTDKGIYTESKDFLSSEKYLVELTFEVDKNTGEVFFSKNIE